MPPPFERMLGRAWNSSGRGALYSARPHPLVRQNPACLLARPQSGGLRFQSLRQYGACSHTEGSLSVLQQSHVRYKPCPPLYTPLVRRRCFSQGVTKQEQQQQQPLKLDATVAKRDVEKDQEEEQSVQEFAKSEKASAAAQLNLSAKLSKDSSQQSHTGGWSEIWRLIKIARPEAKALGIAVTLLLISSGVSMSIPFSIGRILDIATKADGSSDMLFGLDISVFYLALGAVLTLGAAANYGRIIILRIIGERIVTRLRSRLFRRNLIQDAEFFDANRVGDLISRLGADTIIVGKSITQNLSDGLRSLISGAAGLTLMAYVSTKLTGILALMFPPVAIGAFFYGRAMRSLSRKTQKNLGSLTKIAEERLGSIRTTQAFAAEVKELSRYNKQVRKVFSLGKREAYISATFFSTSGLMGNMTILALLYVGGGMVKTGAISIGELTSFLMYTAYAGSSLFGLSGFYSELMKGVGAATRLFELQDRSPTIHPTRGDPVKSARGPIEFHNVTFSYPTRPAVPIFRDLAFRIEQGTNVAIVAPSGAGKSTVASLLLRFYSPGTGTIAIDGKDIETMNAKQLRRKVGFVGQEPVLFSGTIAENISYGKPLASRSEIVAAARKANCQFISDFVSFSFRNYIFEFMLIGVIAGWNRNASWRAWYTAVRGTKAAHRHSSRAHQTT